MKLLARNSIILLVVVLVSGKVCQSTELDSLLDLLNRTVNKRDRIDLLNEISARYYYINNDTLMFYAEEAFKREADDIIRLAETEGLDAHARAVKVRLKKYQE